MKGKMNNSGLTLLEIIVTIAVIALVSIPFLNSFATGMRINNDARYTADAQQTAQDVAEVFNTMSLEDIVKTYGDDPSYVDDADKYTSTFKYGLESDAEDSDIHYVKGGANEKFYIEAEIEADPTTDSAFDFLANTTTVPIMGNINDSGTIMIYDKYKRDDGDLGTSKKYAIINIDTVYKSDTEYIMKVTMETHKDTRNGDLVGSVQNIKTVTVGADEDLPLIYIIPTIYDRYDASGASTIDSEDQIEIQYNYDKTYDAPGTQEKPCHVFLIQQNTEQLNASGGMMSGTHVKLKDANIHYLIGTTLGDTTNKYPLGTKLYLYSNIDNFGQWVTTGLSEDEKKTDGRYTFNKLTDNGKLVKSIYQLKITVREGSKTGRVVSTLTTTLTK
jgi:prepilin-type N-terminal cleavage/methylation domain-containing protein